MSKVYSFPPKLVTTGFAKRFTKTVRFPVDLKDKTLSDYFDNWKLLTPQEASGLYYGEVYRIANPGPDQLLLRVRGRGGDSYHFIDCRYEFDSLVADIKTPNTAAWGYALFPGVIILVLGIVSWPTTLNEVLGVALFFILGVLAGTFFLYKSVESTHDDFLIQLKKTLDK